MQTLEKDQIEAALLYNDEVLSRTQATGTVDTSVSPLKKASTHTPGQTRTQVQENRTLVAHFIAASTPASVRSVDDLLATVVTLAKLTNLGLTEPAQGLYRTWELDSTRKYGPAEDSVTVNVQHVPGHLQKLAAQVVHLASVDLLSAAAQLEWAIGIGPLHPFSDGCGRIARAASAMLLLQSGSNVRLHRSRTEYFEVGSAGAKSFAEYYQKLPLSKRNI